MPSLSIHQIWKTYRAGAGRCRAHAEALRGVDLVIQAGEIVGVVGGRGSGKTTLLRCTAGLLKPDAGTIAWGGTDGATTADRFRAEYVEGGGRPGDVCRRIERHASAPPALLVIDDAFTDPSPTIRAALVALLRRLAATGSAVVASARARSELRGLGARIIQLHAGHVVSAYRHGAPHRSLELLVTSPVVASRLLRAHLGGVERLGDRLHVPLQARTPEEVLAHCSALRITVNASRVVHAGIR